MLLRLQASVRQKLDEGDIRFVLRKDGRKASRAMELLDAQKQAKKIRSLTKTDNFDAEDFHSMVMVTDDDFGMRNHEINEGGAHAGGGGGGQAGEAVLGGAAAVAAMEGDLDLEEELDEDL
jgi:hypothetical protein